MSTDKPRIPKPDRRTIAYLDAAVLAVSGAKGKLPAHELIGQLSRDGIHVTFDQVEKSVRRLGLKWRDAFLPATRVERGYPPSQPMSTATQELASGPDIWAVLNRIEQLEQTLTTWGHAEYRELHRQTQAEAGLAKDRAAAMRADMKKMLNRVDELSIQQQALLRLVSSIRLTQNGQQSEQAQPSQEPQP